MKRILIEGLEINYAQRKVFYIKKGNCTHVRSLRNKLKAAGVNLQIRCIRKVGYCMEIIRI